MYKRQEYAFVAQHAWAEDLHQAAEELIQFFRIERTIAFEDKGGNVVAVMAMMMIVVVMFAVCVTVVIVLMLVFMFVRMFFCCDEVRIDFQFIVEVEAAQIKYIGYRHTAKVSRADGRARIDAFDAFRQRFQFISTDQVCFGEQ